MVDHASFEQAIFADPEDSAAYLVYADWLQSQGDPRGELIVMQHRGVDTTAYLEQHPALRGPLATFLGTQARRGKHLDVTWRYGFVESISIGWGMYDRGGTQADATRELTEILTHPSCRLITKLELGPAPSDDICSPQPLIDAIVAAGGPLGLREIKLGNISDWDISSTGTGNFSAVAGVCKKLRKVILHGGEVDFGTQVSLPELTTLEIQTGALGTSAIEELVAADLPSLTHLVIWFGQANYGASCTVADIAPLLAGRFPKLTHFGLCNCPWVDDAIEPLAGSQLLRGLTTLDLSLGALSDQGVDRMVKHADAFKHLTWCDISDNALSDESLPKLQALWPKLEELGEQDPDRADDRDILDRYTAVGE